MDSEEVSQIGQMGVPKISERLFFKLRETSIGMFSQRVSQSVKSDLSSYDPKSIARFQLNVRGLLDTQNTYLKFKLKVCNPDGTAPANNKPRFGVRGTVAKIIDRVMCQNGGDGTLIEDMTSMGVYFEHLEQNVFSKDYRGTFGQLEGWREPEPEAELADETNSGRTNGYVSISSTAASDNVATLDFAQRMGRDETYIIPIGHIVPFLNTRKLIPMNLLSSLIVQFTFADEKVALQYHKLAPNQAATVATARTAGLANLDPWFKVSDMEIVCELLKPTDIISLSLNRLAAASQVSLPHTGVFLNTVSNVTTGGSYQLNKPVYSNKSIFVLPRKSGEVSSVDFDSYKSVQADSISKYFFTHASNLYPQKPLETVPEYYANQQKAWGHFGDVRYANSYSLDDYKAKGFLASLECEKDNSSDSTGLSSKNQNNIELQIDFNEGSPKQLTWICLYERNVVIGPNLTIKVQE